MHDANYYGCRHLKVRVNLTAVVHDPQLPDPRQTQHPVLKEHIPVRVSDGARPSPLLAPGAGVWPAKN